MILRSYPDETFWKILKVASGAELFSGDYTGMPTQQVCLGIGEHLKFVIMDEFGDGMLKAGGGAVNPV